MLFSEAELASRSEFAVPMNEPANRSGGWRLCCFKTVSTTAPVERLVDRTL